MGFLGYVILILIIGTPVIIALMSFVTWENGFKVLGWKRIIRMQIALAILFSLGQWLATFMK